jgi:GTP cyclohydrolase I
MRSGCRSRKNDRKSTLDEILQPKGVAVVIEATHQCVRTREVHKPGVNVPHAGAFRDDPLSRCEVLAMIGTPSGAKLDNV